MTQLVPNPSEHSFADLQECFGKQYDPTDVGCNGGYNPTDRKNYERCTANTACRTALAHSEAALIPVSRLTKPPVVPQAVVPTAPYMPSLTSTPAAPRPATPAPVPPPAAPTYAPATPAAQPQYLPAASVPMAANATMGQVHYTPHTTYVAPVLSTPEPRRRGKLLKAAAAEAARAGIQGAALQLANFVNQVGWLDDD